MALLRFLSVAVLALAPAPVLAAPACDLRGIEGARALHETLGRRAADLVQRAARPGWRQDARLIALVEPAASVGLGAGDVGRPLGQGPAGLRALAVTMNADSYRFALWIGLDPPVDPCAATSVELEFSDTAAKRVSTVRFLFKNGRLVSADGWEGLFEAGKLPPIQGKSR